MYHIHICRRFKGAKNTVVRDYVLPDYTHIKRGYVKVGHCFKQSLNYCVTHEIQFNMVKTVQCCGSFVSVDCLLQLQ